VPVIDSPQRSNRDAAVPRLVERRLFASYFIVFALLLSAFALAIHLSFVESLKSQMSARLDILLLVGIRSTHITANGVSVQQNVAPTALLTEGQGLEWFDARRNRIAVEGLTPASTRLMVAGEELFQVPNHTLRTRTRAIVNPKNGAIVGWVRGAQDVSQTRIEAWRLDEILIIGGLCALAASVFGGRYLQVQSVRPIRSSYEKLQEFSAHASHDLRTPLTAINSNADAALRDAEGMRPADRERFESILHVAKQMTRLTDDLLLLARADQSIARELFAVDLSALIHEIVRFYHPSFDEHGIRLYEGVQPGNTVYGNPDQIKRILANLLENALRYTPAGGTVDITALRHRAYVAIHVKDTGIGIQPDHIERIFDRFWQADSARTRSSGHGLGLAIARALARRHGGDIHVSSRPGHGSEFIVTLPLRPPAL